MRSLITIAAAALLIGGCAGDDDATVTTTTAPAVAAPTAPATTATTTSAASPETTATPAPESTTTTTTTPAAESTTTTTTVAPGPGVLAITRVVFEPVTYVMITNVGSSPINLGSHWLCRRPAYLQLPDFELQPFDTVALGLDAEPPGDLVGLTETFALGNALGAISRNDGELGLYRGAQFDDPNAIVDYVEWGSPGHGRAATAIAAGIWDEGAFVEVPEEATSIASSGLPAAGFEDWFAEVGG